MAKAPRPRAKEVGPPTTLSKIGDKMKGKKTEDDAMILPIETKPLRKPLGLTKREQKKVEQRQAERKKMDVKNAKRRKTPLQSGVSEWPEEKKVSAKTASKEQEEKDKKAAKTKKEKQAIYNRTYGKQWNEIVYPEIELMLYRQFPKGVDEENAEEMGENGVLNAAVAADLLGWTEESDGVKFGGDYKFKDLEAKKIRLLNNPTNRPFRTRLAMRYANEILRGEWQLNGESIIIDRYGRIQSGQHRLAGVVFAQQMLKDDVERWSEYGWKDGQGVFIETVVVVGIDPSPKVVDTIDVGQKRSLGDVIFRNDEFEGKKEKEAAKMSNDLSHAVRLVWLRCGGKRVSDAPHFPHSEALSFFEEHPRIKECVKFIGDCEGGGGKDGKRISSALSRGYAAGLMYLMATSRTDGESYNAGEGELDFENLKKAQDFWEFFAKETGKYNVGHPIKECRKRCMEISAGDGKGRDEIVGTVVKCFNAWMDGKKLITAKLKRKETEDEIIITEDPRLGGLDIEPEEAK